MSTNRPETGQRLPTLKAEARRRSRAMDASRRTAAWVDLVGDLLTHPTSGLPRQLLERRLYETFGCQVSWNWMDPDGGRGFTLHVPIPGWPTSDGLREMTNAIDHHPLVRWFAA